MTAPIGNPGPSPDVFEQRLRTMKQELDALRQRPGPTQPWLPVVLYPKFAPPAGVYSFMSTPASVSEQSLWEGRIGYLAQPLIQVDGVWGASSGTNTTRYRMKISGVTVGTWDQAAQVTAVHGGFDATVIAAIGSTNRVIEITAQTLSGTGNYACQVFGCYQRQT